MIALLGAGMLVFWLAFSTSIATSAQTAADAAALAAEQSVNTQWNRLVRVGPDTWVPQDSFNPNVVLAAARQQASPPNNDGTVTSVEYCTQGAGCSANSGLFASEPDVLVTVRSNQTMPKESVSPGTGATAQARASTDPYAQAAAPVQQVQTTTSCDSNEVPPAIRGRADVYKTPKGHNGFFEAPHTNFDRGCEPKLAAHLDALAKEKSLKLHLVGIWGAGANDPNGHTGRTGAGNDPTSAAHDCGQLAQVQGLTSAVTDAVLGQYGLARFPGHTDQIEFASSSARCATLTTIPNQDTNNQPVSVGNGKVHLVPLTGGPQGAIPLGLGLPTTGTPGPGIAALMPNIQQIAAQYGWGPALVQDWVGVIQHEDASADPNAMNPTSSAFGIGQFLPMNYGAYGPGSNPADHPTAVQELQAMALYIKQRYVTPAAALASELNRGWY